MLRRESIFKISAKTGLNVKQLLDGVIEAIPAPTGDPKAPVKALILTHFLTHIEALLFWYEFMMVFYEKMIKSN